jgi:DNA-binding beta-propeller fold protein YncE
VLSAAHRQFRGAGRSATRGVATRRAAALLATAALALAGCGSGSHHHARPAPGTTAHGSTAPLSTTTIPGRLAGTLPHGGGGHDVYAADAAGHLSPAVAGAPALVYVPNSQSDTVYEISQRTMKVVRRFSTGALPQHVTPAYDLRTLYVDNDVGNSLTPIDPRTGRPGRAIPVRDPYNLYFTPDGRYAIVVAERMQRLDFRDPHSLRLVHSLYDPTCRGIDHMDFSAHGQYAYASCEFAGRMIEVDLRTQRVVRTLVLGGGNASPQDVKLSPDGRTVYVADQVNGGVWELDARRFRVLRLLPTGAGAHGLYPSRDARVMYVSNRQAGSISVVSFRTRRVITTWTLPPPASPDMGGVSADGRVLWLSGRYNAEVYAISTRTGRLIARIPVGLGPHGLCVWPQPGRYSLGHTGILR